jgi:AhpD family alkylhydroperoxidase
MKARVDYQVVLPAAVEALRDLDAVTRMVSLEPRLLELVRIRASQVNGCRPCVQLHTSRAQALGESEERLAQVGVWRDTAAFSVRERAALNWCEAVTLPPASGAAEDAFEQVAASFDPQEIVALTLAVIAINAWNRLHLALGEPSRAAERPASPSPTKSTTDPRLAKLAAGLEELEERIAQVRDDFRHATEGPPHPRYYEYDGQGITPF